MKYLCLAYGAERDWQALTREEQAPLLAQDQVLLKRGDMLAAVQPTAVTVRAWEGRPITTDGPFAESAAPLAGFSIIEASDLNEAITLVAGTPCARARGAVEIRLIVDTNKIEKRLGLDA